MLEFIVLGQIPGTNLQITVAWFVFGVLALLLWADVKWHVQHKSAKSTAKPRKATSRARA